jgi:hypothetical protein
MFCESLLIAVAVPSRSLTDFFAQVIEPVHCVGRALDECRESDNADPKAEGGECGLHATNDAVGIAPPPLEHRRTLAKVGRQPCEVSDHFQLKAASDHYCALFPRSIIRSLSPAATRSSTVGSSLHGAGQSEDWASWPKPTYSTERRRIMTNSQGWRFRDMSSFHARSSCHEIGEGPRPPCSVGPTSNKRSTRYCKGQSGNFGFLPSRLSFASRDPSFSFGFFSGAFGTACSHAQ